MPLIQMSTPPFMAEPIYYVQCQVCGTDARQWIAFRAIDTLVTICTDCLQVLVKADHEMRRQWVDWSENSDYAPR